MKNVNMPNVNKKSRWNIAMLAAACSTMGFCVATGQNEAPEVRPMPTDPSQYQIQDQDGPSAKTSALDLTMGETTDPAVHD